jgi:hypothetical protein
MKDWSFLDDPFKGDGFTSDPFGSGDPFKNSSFDESTTSSNKVNIECLTL